MFTKSDPLIDKKGWVIVYKHGYQTPVPMIGSTMIKTKGNAYFLNSTTGTKEIWDAIDVVIPPMEKGASFITTNFLTTPLQARGVCNSNDHCTTDRDCEGPSSNADSGGIRTGKCTNGRCEVIAWCPVEADISGKNTTNFLIGVENFTTFIRNSISFPKYNIYADSGSTLINGTNLFTTDFLLRNASVNFKDVQQLGALIGISFDYECNLDLHISKCKPVRTIARLDDPHSKLSTGFNYRYADHYRIRHNETSEFVEHRDLFKLYGVRFIVMISGTGRKFDIKNLATNLGSGLAMLSIAAVIADILLVYILPKKNIYKKVKVKEMDKFIDETDNEEPSAHRINEHDPLLP